MTDGITPTGEELADGPWNPGISSRLPARARPLATVFASANCTIPLSLIDERSDFTGIPPEDLAIFRPSRLALHELLIRVTGDFTVPDGRKTADLGINFRRMTRAIWDHAIEPRLPEIEAAHASLAAELRTEIEQELAPLFRPPEPPPEPERPGILGRLFGRREAPPAAVEIEDPVARTLASWRDEYRTSRDRRRQRLCRGLARVVNNITIRHGRLVGDSGTLTELVLGLVMNDHGSVTIGQMIRPWVMEAAQALDLRLLPAQTEPVILNTKGASAAGKSTLRSRQHHLADEIGVDWQDFALISPDIWRKYLLDYDSLGEFNRYAGMLTGEELHIIDLRLDRYMAGKASRGWMSHLLIDRFRFDSFAEIEEAGLRPKLLTRFGSTIYFFFVITPPEATVERAWRRGLEVGRFKAVDDLLHHNVEAFTGMPDLFFTWATHKEKRVCFEFIDNSVPEGDQPRTVAFGSNHHMVIVDPKYLIDADRYRKINIDARSPAGVYPDEVAMAARNNTDFIRRCASEIDTVEFADRDSGLIYLRLEKAQPVWFDGGVIDIDHADVHIRAAVEAVMSGCRLEHLEGPTQHVRVDTQDAHLLGAAFNQGAAS